MSEAARAEVAEVNQLGRDRIRQGLDDPDARIWFHADDWVRMRPPILLLLALARQDGVVKREEIESIATWALWRLYTSQWANSYGESKKRALIELLPIAARSTHEWPQALDDFSRTVSRRQLGVFRTFAQEIVAQGGEETRIAADIILGTLEQRLAARSKPGDSILQTSA